ASDAEHAEEVAIAGRLHVLLEPVRHVVGVAADDEAVLTQLVERRAGSRHAEVRVLAKLERPVRLDAGHGRRYLHWTAESREAPDVHHGLAALLDRLFVGFGDVDVAAADQVLGPR